MQSTKSEVSNRNELSPAVNGDEMRITVSIVAKILYKVFKLKYI